MRADDLLKCYLETVTGAAVTIRAMPPTEMVGIPMYLKASYRLVRLKLLGADLVAAVQKQDSSTRTPSEYQTHLRLLGEGVGASNVVLVLARMPAYMRQRMVQQRIPFIVPNRQLYLPMLLVDLRERFPRPVRQNDHYVSWPAQMLILRHLYRQPVGEMPLRQLAAALDYSPMSISNAADELETLKMSESRRQGRARHICFLKSGRELWVAIFDKLRSPILCERWITVPDQLAGAIPAGLTALEHYSNIHDDAIPSMAMHDEKFGMLPGEHIHECRYRDEARLRLEIWAYPPDFTGDGKTVDRLSLFLTLRDSPDERVQQALNKMLEGMPW